MQKNLSKIFLPLGTLVILIIGIFAFYNIGHRPPEVDNLFCPKETGPIGATIILLDTSDPLTPKHQSELDRIARQIKSNDDNSLGLEAGELLVVYELQQNPGTPKKLIEICRPHGEINNRTWRDDIHQGRRIAEKNWEHFDKSLSEAFPKQSNAAQPTSPLLESIGVIAARHIPGKRGNKHFKVHFIVFSDLLQHSPRLSHYETYPSAENMLKTHRDLTTDLNGVQVSLFRLDRTKYSKWQTERHYYWWTDLIRLQGGEILWQDSI